MKIERNLGTADKVMRLLVSAIILLLFGLGVIGGPLAAALISLAAVLTITALVSFCPLYRAIGINSKRDASS